MPDEAVDMDELMAPPANPAATMGSAAAGLGRYLAPNIMSLLSGQSAPPPAPLADKPGKTLGTDDPRYAGALAEGAEAGLGALSLMGPGGVAASGARSMESLLARTGARTAAESPSMLGMAGTGAALAGSTEPAEAAQLTRKQQRELQMQREQMQLNRERIQLEGADAAKRAEEANKQAFELEEKRMTMAAEAKRREAEDASRIAIDKQREEQELVRKHEAEMANRPFRQRYPELSNAMSNSGLALAALLPYGTRMWKAGQTSAFIKDWEGVAAKAEKSLANGDLPQARILVDQLSGFKKQAAALENTGDKGGSPMALNAASAALPFETSVLPEAIDLASGSPQAKEGAKDTLLDPVRLPAALMQGATATALGAKAPLLGRNTLPPIARTEGAVKTFKSMTRERIAQAKKAGRKITPVDHDPFK